MKAVRALEMTKLDMQHTGLSARAAYAEWPESYEKFSCELRTRESGGETNRKEGGRNVK